MARRYENRAVRKYIEKKIGDQRALLSVLPSDDGKKKGKKKKLSVGKASGKRTKSLLDKEETDKASGRVKKNKTGLDIGVVGTEEEQVNSRSERGEDGNTTPRSSRDNLGDGSSMTEDTSNSAPASPTSITSAASATPITTATSTPVAASVTTSTFITSISGGSTDISMSTSVDHSYIINSSEVQFPGGQEKCAIGDPGAFPALQFIPLMIAIQVISFPIRIRIFTSI